MKTELMAKHLASIQKVFSEFSVYFTVIATGVTWALGGWDTAIRVLIAFIVVDIITGVIRGMFFRHNFSSQRLKKGLGTKIGYLIVIMLCNMLDMVFFVDSPILRTASIYFYVTVEGTSIVENLSSMGVPIPNYVKEKLTQLNSTNTSSQSGQSNQAK